MKNVAVLMAGGRGQRFWPHSRFDTPKQLLSITGGNSMIRETVNRVLPLIDLSDIFISTTEDLFNSIKDALPEMDYLNYILEPVGKDTAACVGLAAVILEHRYKDPATTMITLPIDHIIKDCEKFLEVIKEACVLARETGNLITIGIKPSRPETGYGYIYVGEEVKKTENITACAVNNFTEKPDLETAKKFISEKKYLWNSGIFVWTCADILKAIKKEIPNLYQGLMKVKDSLGTLHKKEILKDVFYGLEKISIDYAIMEKVSNRLVVKGDFSWDDIGSWTSMERIFPRDKDGNVIKGSHEGVDTERCVIINDEGLVVTIGLSDLVIVSSGDIKLIYPKKREGDLKKIIKRMVNNHNYKKYL
ncbi:MAG TPA: mannose-1-phosphate guanylyltransferase [Candidatus Atribacteria bacterium]|nr:mannose-1-phosphate guanylyltransferase [Candidatus Atribacteria bacterium]